MELFATCGTGLEVILGQELRDLGMQERCVQGRLGAGLCRLAVVSRREPRPTHRRARGRDGLR